ncbi:hypothetical protein BC943DRAFT_273680 [Umbelopsis sp. AD052]|nr:hypothetical protein BC943DRAFT_273680 [Umbelopsis sp. AD052]
MNNTKLLSAGSRIYAKKRKQKQETVDRIDFDFDARQVDRLQARAEAREERQRLADQNMTQMAALLKQDGDDVKFDSDEEVEGAEPAAKLEPAVKEFATSTSLTTVTVIQDLELDDSYQSSTSNKRKAEDDVPHEDGDGDETKKIPSNVRIHGMLKTQHLQKANILENLNRAKRSPPKNLRRRLQSKYNSTQSSITFNAD